MSKRRVVLICIAAFACGYLAHIAVMEYRLERSRRFQETVFRSEFPLGADFDKLAAKWNQGGLDFWHPSGTNVYYADRGGDPSLWLTLVVEIDERRLTGC